MANKKDCALMPDSTTEYDTCFTFFYQSTSYLKSGNMNEMLVGHGPVIIDKQTGKVFETGSAYSEQRYVMAYEACGDPFASPKNSVIVQGWLPNADKVTATKFVKKVSTLSLSEAKKIIDHALDDKSTTFDVLPEYDTSEVVKKLNKIGFRSKQLWSSK